MLLRVNNAIVDLFMYIVYIYLYMILILFDEYIDYKIRASYLFRQPVERMIGPCAI